MKKLWIGIIAFLTLIIFLLLIFKNFITMDDQIDRIVRNQEKIHTLNELREEGNPNSVVKIVIPDQVPPFENSIINYPGNENVPTHLTSQILDFVREKMDLLENKRAELAYECYEANGCLYCYTEKGWEEICRH